MKKIIKKIDRITLSIYTFIIVFFTVNIENTYANSLANSTLVKGTMKLLDDASIVLMGASSIIALLMVIWYQIRKKFADDEMESKQFDKKTKGVLFAYIIILTASGIIKGITYYYKEGAGI